MRVAKVLPIYLDSTTPAPLRPAERGNEDVLVVVPRISSVSLALSKALALLGEGWVRARPSYHALFHEHANLE